MTAPLLIPSPPRLPGDWESNTRIKVLRDDDPDPQWAIEKSEAYIAFNHNGGGSFENHTGWQNSIQWKILDPDKRTLSVQR